MRKTIFKVIGALLIVSALILTQIPVLGTKASSVINNGFMMDGTKLVKYTGTANAVSVPDGVKTIGAEAFAENIALSSISFPKGLETIENGAFSGCTQLRRIIIPEGCTTIGNGVFADCDKLEYVSLPTSLHELGTSTFAGCNRLKSVLLDKNPNFICEDGVIYNAKKTVLYQVLAGRINPVYQMPNSVEKIKKYAFWGCSYLTSINISSNIEEIDDFVFSNATGLETINLPYSIRYIRRKAFEDCRNLKDITIPPSVTEIDSTAFDGCFHLNIIAEDGTEGFRFRTEYENSVAANEEYEDTLENSENPSSEEGSSSEAKSNYVVPYASNVEHYVEWDVDSPGVLGRSKVVSGQAVVLMKTDDIAVQDGSNSSEESREEILNIANIPEAIVGPDTIGYQAFYCNNTISKIQLPDYIRALDDFSFARCSSLKEVNLPQGVRTIGKAAFYHCNQLEQVVIPASVTTIGEDAFSHTPWLENWFSGGDVDDFLIVGDGILLAYKGNQSQVVIPASVHQIGAGAFKNHTEITKVTIPDSVTVIGENAFLNCSSLSTLTGMNQVSDIKDAAFYGCPIETVRIPASVKNIGISAFGGTNKTDSVIFLGNGLPKFTYEDTSTRLSSKRNPSFDGIQTAVVNNSVSAKDLTDTILDSKNPCFQGIVYHIDGTDVKTARAIASNETQTNTKIPDVIRVYGNSYTIMPSQNILYEEEKASVSDNSLQACMVVKHQALHKKDVSVTQSGATKDLSGYHFYVSDANGEYNALKAAIETYYGSVNETNSLYFDLSLYDETRQIPIRQLGKDALTITMPVPSDLIGRELCVVTLDRNRRPEVIFPELLVKDKRQFVSFDISHCSPYVLYAPEGELKEAIMTKQSNVSGMAGLDDTPNTGDNSPVKTILLIGLFSLGAFWVLLGFFEKGISKR